MKKQNFITLYLPLILFYSSHLCFSQIMEYKPIGSDYPGEVTRGNLHKIKGNVKSFTTRIFKYNSDNNEYLESFGTYPEKYETSKYILDKNGNIIERVLIGSIADYYKTSKSYKISSKKTNILHKKWTTIRKNNTKEDEIIHWDYLCKKKITMSLIDKYGFVYSRDKNNLNVYFLEYENEHLFDENGNVKNPDNNIKSKELRSKFKYNDFNKVEKCESFNGSRQIWNYFYDENHNLIREDIYYYSGGKFYELEMKIYSLNDKNDVIKKKVYRAYVYENPYDENIILSKLVSTVIDNEESEIKYDKEEFRYSYQYDDYGNWTTKFYPSLDTKMKVVRDFEYYEKK